MKFTVCIWKEDKSIKRLNTFETYDLAIKYLRNLHLNLLSKGEKRDAENLFIDHTEI